MKIHAPIKTRIACAVLAALLALPAIAEPDESMDEMSLSDLLSIEVTVASNFAETELQTGSTVEAVFDRVWQDHGAQSVTEAIGHLPGTMVYPVPWGGSAIAIRGYASSLSVRGIATVLDGIPLNLLSSGTATYDIRSFSVANLNRIEMIRGPGSALYGSDAFHGVLSLKTYESEQDAASIHADMSSEGFSRASVNFTRHSDDGLAFNASVSRTNQSSQDIAYQFTHPATGQQVHSSRSDSYNAYMGSFKLAVEHKEQIKSFYGLYFKGDDSEESVGPGQSQSPFGSIFGDRDITNGENDLTAMRAGVEVAMDNDITFEGKAFHWQTEFENVTDLTPLGLGLNRGQTEETHLGVDLLLKQPDNAFNTQWTVGLSYKSGEVDRNETAIIDDTGKVLFPLPGNTTGFDRTVRSLIISAKTRFMDDKLAVLYGGRFDKYSDFGQQKTPRAGLIYAPNQQSAFKWLYGEAFRAPIAAELRGAGVLRGNENLKPEVIETTEWIYMYQGEFWKLNLTYFESEWSDGIVLIPTTVTGFSQEYANIGSNESDGVEVTFRGQYDNWRWDLSGSKVSSTAITALGNNDYVAFPETVLNINVGYRFVEQKLDLYVSNRFHFDAKEGPIVASLTGQGPDNVPNPKDLKDYHSTDITLDWQANDQLNVQLGVRNVFDRDNFVPSVWNGENGVRTPGRYFQLSVRYSL